MKDLTYFLSLLSEQAHLQRNHFIMTTSFGQWTDILSQKRDRNNALERGSPHSRPYNAIRILPQPHTLSANHDH